MSWNSQTPFDYYLRRAIPAVSSQCGRLFLIRDVGTVGPLVHTWGGSDYHYAQACPHISHDVRVRLSCFGGCSWCKDFKNRFRFLPNQTVNWHNKRCKVMTPGQSTVYTVSTGSWAAKQYGRPTNILMDRQITGITRCSITFFNIACAYYVLWTKYSRVHNFCCWHGKMAIIIKSKYLVYIWCCYILVTPHMWCTCVCAWGGTGILYHWEEKTRKGGLFYAFWKKPKLISAILT
jgi:hypothetical protein